MAFTRFHDDPCRIKKQLQESTGAGRYMLNKPGWGANPCFMDDPYIRMEQWGANLQTNTINLESDLIVGEHSSIVSPPQNCLKMVFFTMKLTGILSFRAIIIMNLPSLTIKGEPIIRNSQ